MQRIHTTENPTEAHFVKGLLESRGIAALVLEEGMIGDFPSVWATVDADFEMAQKVVSALVDTKSFDDTKRQEWLCPNCREQLELQFLACWRCGMSRPGAS